MSGNRKLPRASQMQPIVTHANDVLNGRGVKIAQHPGNLRFRSLVKEMQDVRYCESFTSCEKKVLAREIIHHIKNKLSPPGRFLKKKSNDGPWIELTKTEIEKKTKQALRDCNRIDRTGYAKQVTAPQDVARADQERKRSGLSLLEHARNKVDEESRRGKTRSGNNSRKTQSSSSTVSRSSRLSSEVNANSAIAIGRVPDAHISSQRPMHERINLQGHQSNEAAIPEGWAVASATLSATPGVRQYGDAVPVTNTPNPTSFSFSQANSHDHHQPNHSGSQPQLINHSNPVLMYPDHYPPGVGYHEHPTSSAPIENSLNKFPSPVVRSPSVGQETQCNTHTFEGHDEPFLDDWATGPSRQNLFPHEHEDPLDTMAASASANLSNDRVDEFILDF